MLSRPGNDFVWSGWDGRDEALRELDEKIAAVLRGPLPDRLGLCVLFAPTGPIQEVSVSSGWGKEFLAVAARFDAAAARRLRIGNPSRSLITVLTPFLNARPSRRNDRRHSAASPTTRSVRISTQIAAFRSAYLRTPSRRPG